MSQKLKKFAPLLRKLYKAKPKAVKKILKDKCDKELIVCLSECCKNILKSTVKLTPGQKNKLSRHKQSLRKLVLKKTSLKTKKRIIQKGGFLGALLGPIVSILGSLFKQ